MKAKNTWISVFISLEMEFSWNSLLWWSPRFVLCPPVPARKPRTVTCLSVRFETCSHWLSNIQKQNLTDVKTDTAFSNISGQAGPHNVDTTVYPQSCFAVNCQWSERHASRDWNVSAHREMYTAWACREAEGTSGLLAGQGKPSPNVDKRSRFNSAQDEWVVKAFRGGAREVM